MVGGKRTASLASFFNFGMCRSNGNLQMRRVRIAVISIGPMVSCEFHINRAKKMYFLIFRPPSGKTM